MPITRRHLLASSIPFATIAGASCASAPKSLPKVTGFEMIPVRATERTVWIFVRLLTDRGLIGLGEASDAYGYANTSKAQAQELERLIAAFVDLATGKPVLDIERYRQAGWEDASKGGMPSATAFCAVEQALWDLAGQALGVPSYELWGGKVRDSLPTYANINRATRTRTPDGFAESARRAVAEGFRAVKAAPFDGFPKAGASAAEVTAHVDNGVACVLAMRQAVGPDVRVLIDCHSFFPVPLAIDVAKRLEPANLGWYEEPLPPERVAETREIRDAIAQPVAGGEFLFAVRGFEELCRQQAVDVIMPDAKFCGGLLEMTHIAAMAFANGVAVAPHNPSGPVCTAGTVQACAGMRNFDTLEMQWGEAEWRGELLNPPERFVGGEIGVPSAPGFGVSLNDELAKAHSL